MKETLWVSHQVPGCLSFHALSHGKKEEGKLQKYFLMMEMMLAELLRAERRPAVKRRRGRAGGRRTP